MTWIGSILVALFKRLWPAAVIWYCTQERGELHRESDRERWWGFSERAKTTQTKVDDAVAVYLKARFNFHDSPEVKLSKTAMAKVDEIRAKFSGPHQP